ncbi:MAG: xanthine dehydrogenase family protein subunit M [Deferrisomatales bacterium]|nr:xanthine dehydrogenase family protein subunit M [Deferrisomatales bacterium]
MQTFTYLRPETLEEALALLAEREGAVPVAGATDVWVGVQAKKLAPGALVSLRRVAGLRGIREGEGGLVLGATTTHAEIEDSAAVRERFPALHRACSAVGSRQVRNVGTVGGNLCNAAPSADSAVPLLLYDAVCVARGPRGERSFPVEELFLGPGKNALAAGELLTEIRVPAPAPGTHGDYWKLTRRKAVELPILGVGALVTLDGEGTVRQARIALGVAGPTPLRAREAEALLEGRPLTRESVGEAADAAARGAQVRDSWRGQAWYRREMIRVLIPRVLERAGALAG